MEALQRLLDVRATSEPPAWLEDRPRYGEWQRAMIRERTQAGLAVARAQGRIGGRRPKLGPQQQAAIVDLVTSGRQTQAAAARLFHVHPATVSRLLAEHRHQDAPLLNSSCDE